MAKADMDIEMNGASSSKDTNKLGLTPTGYEREKLNRLLKILDGGFGVDESKRRVRFRDAEKDSPRLLTQRVKTFYVESWPEVKVKLGNTIRPMSGSRHLIGGTPITVETAVSLKHMIFGSWASQVHFFSTEWRKSTIDFYDISGPFSFGLQTLKCGSRGLVLAIQAYLLKSLIFDRQFASIALIRSALQPNDFERRRALISAMCQILWLVGDNRRCCVCLQQVDRCYANDYRCRDDGITEKILLFEFKKYQDLEMFMKRHWTEFQREGNNGCIMFLYSIILSRTPGKIYEDLQMDEDDRQRKLLTDNEACSTAFLNLLMTGMATPYLHNNNQIYSEEAKVLAKPRRGIQSRSTIGFLYFDKTEPQKDRTEVGSMLKTPKLPIWLTSTNGQIGLLFSNKIELVSDWRVENRFSLQYYTGLSAHKPCTLEIETRNGRTIRGQTLLTRRKEDDRIPSLEQGIMTKWYGAAIKWQGCDPFI
ncbi:inactive ubiquitin carboxyl-terminal hydrolase MINDY-4B-like isoform X2 [Mizuhopecten yessoensis]|uniref:inactive ubiquitin carboxyl-terminal hydrolase MINDY-4B-like isoform X2 n=1 Tax=Mizuhopecten yessoensis TaxID=6573 RepID=UPI000B45868D|nr:inactive ubiquitin carboxyl-terminal hydrolase MINDY-4B-like isoform X2 [Mizuhopecten yessoensis]